MAVAPIKALPHPRADYAHQRAWRLPPNCPQDDLATCAPFRVYAYAAA